jgi:chromosome segregation ATPase
MVAALTLVSLALLGCDNKAIEDGISDNKSKSIYDVKQKAKTEMSKEELEEARRKAGFKSHEERLEEAKAQYDQMEKGYVKGRLSAYRDLVKGLRDKLDEVEKAAPKWAKNEAAFKKFSEKYKEDNTAFKKQYDELSEQGNRGGNLQVDLGSLVDEWENFNGDLAPQISEAEGFATTLEGLRTKIGDIEKALDEIEKDETIEADELPEDDKDKDGAKGKKKK